MTQLPPFILTYSAGHARKSRLEDRGRRQGGQHLRKDKPPVA